MEHLLLWLLSHCCLTIFWAVIIAVATFTIIIFAPLETETRSSLLELADYIWGIFFILGTVILLFNACPVGSEESLKFLYFSLGIGLTAGFLNWRLVLTRDSSWSSLHPLSFGAIVFSIVAASCYSHHWVIFGFFMVWTILLVIISLILGRVDKKWKTLTD